MPILADIRRANVNMAIPEKRKEEPSVNRINDKWQTNGGQNNIWEKLKKQKQKTQIHFILLYFTIFLELYSCTKLRSDNRLVDNNRTLTYKPVHKGVKSFFWSLLGHILLKNELQNIDTR